jgi:ribosomal subunit interface protein
MQVLISGKNIDVGDALRAQIERRLAHEVTKYFEGAVRGHVTLAKERGAFRAECTLHLATGITLQAQGHAGDAYASFDLAADHLENRLRRYKRRLKNHHRTRAREPVESTEVPTFVIAAAHEGGEEPHDLSPAIIAENSSPLQKLTVGEAVMQLEISDRPFVFFRNAGHGGLNVVYRRDDGNIGWVDPGAAGAPREV